MILIYQAALPQGISTSTKRTIEVTKKLIKPGVGRIGGREVARPLLFRVYDTKGQRAAGAAEISVALLRYLTSGGNSIFRTDGEHKRGTLQVTQGKKKKKTKRNRLMHHKGQEGQSTVGTGQGNKAMTKNWRRNRKVWRSVLKTTTG